MRLLVLGGTAWLGHEIAGAGVRAGHEVICFARGISGGVPAGATLVTGDRDDPAGLASLDGSFDAVIDVGTQPSQVRRSARALVGRCAHYGFVSTVSVYADNATLWQDESGPTLPPSDGDDLRDPQAYGPAKIACEQAVLEAHPGAALVVRAGLIAGPGDRSGRTSYWPQRFARPAGQGGGVLVPDAPALGTQVIDVRDLAGWLVQAPMTGATGIVNAVGLSLPLPEHLAAARAVAGAAASPVPAAPAWLVRQGVAYWAGPRSLPLWLPLPDCAGLGTRSNARALGLGLRLRPLAETLADTLAWCETLGADLPRGAGLSPEEERLLLDALTAGG